MYVYAYICILDDCPWPCRRNADVESCAIAAICLKYNSVFTNDCILSYHSLYTVQILCGSETLNCTTM